MTFHQQGWQVEGDVYNVAGNLLLTKTGNREDFVRALLSVREDLLSASALDDTSRAEIVADFDQAAEEARKPNAQPDEVIRWLDRAKNRLAALGGTAGALVTLSGPVAQLITWAGTYL